MNASGMLQRELKRPEVQAIPIRLLDWWGGRPLDTPFRMSVFFAVLVLLCAVKGIFSGFPQNVYTHDSFVFLDGAWRILNGQRPQVEFYSNLGPIMYLFTAAGFAVTRQAGHALGFAQALFGLVATSAVGYISFKRLEQWPAIILTTLATLLAISPCNTGEEPFSLTYAMMYNRVGYALLAAILVEAMLPPAVSQPDRSRRDEWIGGALSGFVWMFLFFLKFTYGLVAGGILVGLLPCRTQSRSRIAGLAAGTAISLLAVLAYLRFEMKKLAASLLLGAAKSTNIPEALSKALGSLQEVVPLILFAMLAATVASVASRQQPVRSIALNGWAMALACLAALALLLTNAQRQGLPVAVSMAVVLAGALAGVAHSRIRESAGNSWLAALVLIGLLFPAVLTIGQNFAGLGTSWIRLAGFRRTPEERSFDSPAARDVSTKNQFLVGLQIHYYADYVNEGVRLLRANTSTTDSVLALDFVNPFNFLLQRPPATGGITCLHYQSTFDEKHHPSLDELVGDSRILMWPKHYEEPQLGRGIELVYAAGLRERFTPIAESDNWTLYRRTEQGSSAVRDKQAIVNASQVR